MRYKLSALSLLLVSALVAQPSTSNATRIWGRPIDSAAPTDGYALIWSASQAKWIIGNPGSGGASPWTRTGTTISTTNAGDTVAVGYPVPAAIGAMLTVYDTRTTSPRGFMSVQTSTDTNGARVGFAKARGTAAAPTTVVSGDILGRMMFRGYDSANYLEMGSIEIASTGTIAATRVPTYMSFSTATDATPSVLTEAMRILPNGNVGIGTTSPAHTLDVYGTAAFGQTNQVTVSSAGTVSVGSTLINPVTGISQSGVYALSISSNSIMGYNAGNSSISGVGNVLLGLSAGSAITTGYDNTVVGEHSGGVGYQPLTTGYYNTIVGADSQIGNVTGYGNTSMGVDALQVGAAPINLTAFGMLAGQNSDGNIGLAAFGSTAAQENTSGASITAIGQGAYGHATTANRNTAVGYDSLFGALVSGDDDNAAFGYGALYSTTGTQNVGVGSHTLYYDTTGYGNTAVGYNNFGSLTSGSDNTAIGNWAGGGFVNQNFNTAVGAFTQGPSGGYYTIELGAYATASASGHAVIGNNQVTDVYLGSETPVATLHAAGLLANGNVGIGTTAPAYSLDVSGGYGLTGTARFYDQKNGVNSATLVTITAGAAQTVASTVLTVGGVIKLGGTNSTGSTTALLGTNSPAITGTAPYTWVTVVTSDGSTGFIPVWK